MILFGFFSVGPQGCHANFFQETLKREWDSTKKIYSSMYEELQCVCHSQIPIFRSQRSLDHQHLRDRDKRVGQICHALRDCACPMFSPGLQFHLRVSDTVGS